jgi:DNA-binding CsgD family transcriptional regulator
MPRARYLRADAWLTDLHALHAQGLSDRAIARELSRRYSHLTFTHDRVRYWRTAEDRIAQDGECVPQHRFDIHHRRAVHQMLRGFGHLLPLPLRQREADILALLRQRGPLTRPEIARALGVRTLLTHQQHWLVRLFRLGLIVVAGTVPGRRRPLRRYALAPSAMPVSGCA